MDEMNRIQKEERSSKITSYENQPAKAAKSKKHLIVCKIACFVVAILAIAFVLTGCSHEHSFGEWTKVGDPTCTETGLEERLCECGEKDTRPINALGHKEIIDNAVEATCTSTGLTEGSHCSVCNEVIAEQNVVPKSGHKAVTDKAVAATCTSTGLTEGSHCSVCKTVIVKQEVTPKADHRVVTDKAVAATCTSTGLTEGSHCSICKTVIVKQTVTSKTSHTIVGGSCTYCGYISDPYRGLANYVRTNGKLNSDGDEYYVIYSFEASDGAEYIYSIYTNTSGTSLDFRMLIYSANGLQTFVTLELVNGASTHEVNILITFTDGSQFFGMGKIYSSSFDSDGYIYDYQYSNAYLASTAKDLFVLDIDFMLSLININALPKTGLGITLSDLGFKRYA